MKKVYLVSISLIFLFVVFQSIAFTQTAKRKVDKVWSRFTSVSGTWRAADFAIKIAGKKQPDLHVYIVKDANDLDFLTSYLCWYYARRNKDVQVEVHSLWGGHFNSVECESNYAPEDSRSYPPSF